MKRKILHFFPPQVLPVSVFSCIHVVIHLLRICLVSGIVKGAIVSCLENI